jgi:hypothetical protein
LRGHRFFAYSGYHRFIVPWQDGNNFAGKGLNEFGKETLGFPAPEGVELEKPYRRGRVLIIMTDKRVSDTSIIGSKAASGLVFAAGGAASGRGANTDTR